VNPRRFNEALIRRVERQGVPNPVMMVHSFTREEKLADQRRGRSVGG
jgi:hypothetical protein